MTSNTTETSHAGAANGAHGTHPTSSTDQVVNRSGLALSVYEPLQYDDGSGKSVWPLSIVRADQGPHLVLAHLPKAR